MSRRIIHDKDFIQYVMTPPIQEAPGYGQDYRPGEMNVITRNPKQEGLGELPAGGMWSGAESNSWMPIVIIVVSAMALITVYAVVMKR